MHRGKGDPLVSGSYKVVKLLEQPINVFKRVLESEDACQKKKLQCSIVVSMVSCRW